MGTKKNMRFVISENRLNDIILNFINNYYDVDEIHSSPFHDEDGNPTNKAIEYYLGDWGDGEEIFRLYNESYWINPGDFRKELSPILMIENENFVSHLNSMFQDKWKPVFKEWFKENFGEEIRTIDFY